MLHSDKYSQTTITINGNQYEMEYDLAQTINETSFRCFGNIYIDPDDPMEFTYFTLNDVISGYTPMNGTRELIGNIVNTTLGRQLPFDDIAGM